MRQNEDEGDQQDDLAQTGQQQTDFGLPQRHEALLARDLNTHGKDAGHIDPHGPRGVLDEGGVRSEDARHRAGNQHHQQPEQGRVAEAEGQLEAEGLLDAALFARAEVEAHHRLAALADALKGQGRQLGSAGDDRHSAHGHVAAVPGEAGAEADGEQTLGGEHDERGDAQRYDGQDGLLFRLQVLFFQLESGLGAGEEAQDPDGTHGLTEHGGDGRALHAQTQRENQDGVQHNIDDRAHRLGDHGIEGTSGGLQNPVQGDTGKHAYTYAAADGQVIRAIVYNGRNVGLNGIK